ncbi:MAG TPA: hypothetical protein VFI02_03725 [Armatimonadota bacterium]|nr:hypothetical protein [Armatimonadota bacterium]
MIDVVDFKGMCDRVARVTGKIDEEGRKIYYEALKDIKRETVFRAMKRVAREHGFYKFPTLAEIMDAVKDCQSETKLQAPVYCAECNSTGIIIAEVKGYNTAYRCSCENGKRISKRIRAFSEVAGLFEGPAEPGRLSLVSMADLELMAPADVFDGVAVGKICATCWKPFRFEHRRKITVKDLRVFHLTRESMCEDCYVQTGKDKGVYT